MNYFSRYEKEKKDGVEDSAQFWMGVFNLNSLDEFRELVDVTRLETFNKTNEEVMTLAKECVSDYDLNYEFLDEPIKPRDKFIKIFDEFNDRKASKRIIDYIESS